MKKYNTSCRSARGRFIFLGAKLTVTRFLHCAGEKGVSKEIFVAATQTGGQKAGVTSYRKHILTGHYAMERVVD